MDITSFLLGYESGKTTTGGGDEDYSEVNSILDEINGEVINAVKYLVTFIHDNKTVYSTEVYEGADCQDPVAANSIDEPTKAGTAQYSYTFDGWATTPNGDADASALLAISENKTLYAVFKATVNKYTVRFLDDDGTLLQSVTYTYGRTPSFTPEKKGYEFVRWEPAIAVVTGNAVYTAVWNKLTALETLTWAEIAQVSESGNAVGTFGIGDRKPLTLTYEDGTTETTEAILIGMNCDDLANGTGKAGLTFQIKPLSKTEQFNEGDKEYGGITGGAAGGWPLSDLRGTYSSKYLNALPNELMQSVKEVSKESNYPVGNGAYQFQNTNDKIWSLSCEEIFANFTQAQSFISNLRSDEEFSTWRQYEYYTKEGVDSVLTEISESLAVGDNAWLRTVDGVHVTYTVFKVNRTAIGSTGGTAHVMFGFCI